MRNLSASVLHCAFIVSVNEVMCAQPEPQVPHLYPLYYSLCTIIVQLYTEYYIESGGHKHKSKQVGYLIKITNKMYNII